MYTIEKSITGQDFIFILPRELATLTCNRKKTVKQILAKIPVTVTGLNATQRAIKVVIKII